MKTILIFTTLIFFAIVSKAQSGTLDKSFGIDGKVITGFGAGAAPQINKAVLQSDDKIIEAGSYHSDDIEAPQGFLAVRYTADGALDYNYGDSGKKIIQFSFAEDSYVYDAALQKDGKVLLAGYGIDYDINTIYYGIITRLNLNGSVDSTFGTNGAIQTTVNGSGSYSAIAVQSDNKIIATGGAGNSVFINRFSADGTLDKTFGENGYAYISSNNVFYTCKMQADGKIVVAGYYYKGNITNRKFCLQRYLPDGTIDKAFGDNGTIITAYGDDGWIHDLAFQSDGKIVATGETTDYSPYNTSFATARYNQNGNLDSTFGINGKVTTMFGDSLCIAKSVVVQKDDKVIIGGYKQLDLDTASEFAIIRLAVNGVYDSAFGYNGKVFTDFGYASSISSVLLQSTSKIVAAGESGIPPTFNCSLARYNNDESKKQIIITKIKKWLQHRNGIMWNANSNISSNVVQRSTDGINWTTVHSQQTIDNSQLPIVNSQLSTVNYYNDPAPLSDNNYYRLQTTSTSGDVNYSNVIAVSNSDIKVSPNPAKNSLHIEGLSSNQNLPAGRQVKLTVVNFSGNIAINQQLTANGNHSYNLNIASLKPGNYLLKIESNDEVVTKKFVKE